MFNFKLDFLTGTLHFYIFLAYCCKALCTSTHELVGYVLTIRKYALFFRLTSLLSYSDETKCPSAASFHIYLVDLLVIILLDFNRSLVSEVDMREYWQQLPINCSTLSHFSWLHSAWRIAGISPKFYCLYVFIFL